MQDRTHNNLQFRVTAIVDDALAELMLLDPKMSRDDAAFLMAAQATVRIDDNEKRRQLENYVSELVWDIDDTQPGDPR